MFVWLRRLTDVIARCETWLLVSLLGMLVLVAGLQIFARLVLGLSPIWMDGLQRALVLWVGLIGALAAAGEARHIRIEVLAVMLPRAAQKPLEHVTDFIAAVVCGLLCVLAVQLVVLEASAPAVVFLGLPSYVPQLVLPIGFGLMALRFLLLAVLGRIAVTPVPGR